VRGDFGMCAVWGGEHPETCGAFLRPRCGWCGRARGRNIYKRRCAGRALAGRCLPRHTSVTTIATVPRHRSVQRLQPLGVAQSGVGGKSARRRAGEKEGGRGRGRGRGKDTGREGREEDEGEIESKRGRVRARARETRVIAVSSVDGAAHALNDEERQEAEQEQGHRNHPVLGKVRARVRDSCRTHRPSRLGRKRDGSEGREEAGKGGREQEDARGSGRTSRQSAWEAGEGRGKGVRGWWCVCGGGRGHQTQTNFVNEMPAEQSAAIFTIT